MGDAELVHADPTLLYNFEHCIGKVCSNTMPVFVLLYAASRIPARELVRCST